MTFTRRTFLTTASGVALGTRLASARAQGANDRIRVGVIGTGGRARGLMNHLKTIAGAELTAVCDVYEPRMLQAAEIAGVNALKVADYRRILDSREIDAVVIGTPDHWHKTMTLDAVAAGKDVYVEKPVSRTIDEGVELVRAIEASRQIVQTACSARSRSSTPTGTSTPAPVTTPRWRSRSSTGSAGLARRPISRSGRSASTSGGTTGTSAAGA